MRSLVCGVSLLLLSLCRGPAAAAQTPAQPQIASSSQKEPAAGFAGDEICATCHEDEVKAFGKNPHSRLAHDHPGGMCEACHGPAKAHVDSGGEVATLFRFTKAPPKEVADKCLGCHRGQHPYFEQTAHGEAGVSCVSCHSVHNFHEQTLLLKNTQPQLCYQCHTDVKTQFSMPFHHRVNEGLMRCTDCHDPHGTLRENNLRSSADQDMVCTTCHSETAGPFVYEHPPLKTEGCTACHFPHGSPNARLLTRSNVNSLCLQCHTASLNFTAPGTPSFHNQANQYQACTVCHTQIHGSNADSFFFK